MSPGTALRRALGTPSAVFIGLGSMIGAGVFAAFGPASAAAGSGLLLGLVIAAVVAFCNATSSAQLARVYPVSGGTYVYGRERLGEWWGYAAGWSFVVGKTASCAAMALTFAAYAVPPAWQRPTAILAVVGLTAVNYRGVTRTALLARIIVSLTLVTLVTVVAATAGRWMPAVPTLSAGLLDRGWYGVLQSAGLLFFAFAGYARIATMGEEVRDPARTIPRAILIALAVTIGVYSIVALALLGSLGVGRLSGSAQPLADSARAAGMPWLVPVVVIGAAIASLGALLGLIAGVSRTALAMARNGDLPRGLGAVHPRFAVPHRAELLLALVVCVAILFTSARGAIEVSSFGVLLYYSIANLSALTQGRADRRYPRVLQILGLVGCSALVVTLPWPAIIVGALILVAGLAIRAIRPTGKN